MIDPDRVARLLSDIEESLKVISDIVRVSIDRFLADVRSSMRLDTLSWKLLRRHPPSDSTY